jgi:polyisoprenoid-binding protein YceI
MKIKQILTVSAFMLLLPGASEWKVDPNTKVSFTVHGPFGMVHGSFTGLEATIQFDEKNPSAGSVIASVDAKTVSSGVSLRNSDLRNKEEWLNTDKYPRIHFKSKKIDKTANGFSVSGELTLKSITKPVVIPFNFTGKGNTGNFKGQFTIRREDFNVGKPGGSVGDIITIMLDVPVKN